jgi:nitroreductase
MEFQGRMKWTPKKRFTRAVPTRDYTAEPVSEKIIRELIDAAIQAPTAVNAQPCTFRVVHDRRDA